MLPRYPLSKIYAAHSCGFPRPRKSSEEALYKAIEVVCVANGTDAKITGPLMVNLENVDLEKIVKKLKVLQGILSHLVKKDSNRKFVDLAKAYSKNFKDMMTVIHRDFLYELKLKTPDKSYGDYLEEDKDYTDSLMIRPLIAFAIAVYCYLDGEHPELIKKYQSDF